jgi:hypothetical protein
VFFRARRLPPEAADSNPGIRHMSEKNDDATEKLKWRTPAQRAGPRQIN